MPKVSVVILTFNRAPILRRAIQSVLDQTFQDLELIVIDDCSTDETAQVVKSFSDARIKYFRHEKNKGEAGGRNTGLQKAMGEYIGYLDDDDEWLPEKLELQVASLNQSPFEVGAVHCGRMDVDVETGKVLNVRVYPESGDLFSRLLKENFLTLSSVLLRTKCFAQVGEFDCSIPYGLDYDMWLRISQKFQFECINQPLIKYGIHKNALSKNLGLQIRGYEAWLEKYDRFIKEDLKEYSRRNYILGMMYCMNGDTSKGREIILGVIKGYPMNPKAYVILVGSFLGSFGFRKMLYLWGKIMGRQMVIPGL